MPDEQQASTEVMDPLARHCRDSGHMRPGLGKAHYKAFMPARDRKASVFYAGGQTVATLEQIGRAVVAMSVRGHALVAKMTVEGRNLQIVADPEPHPLHANIVGWDEDDSKNRLHAHALAEASQLIVY